MYNVRFAVQNKLDKKYRITLKLTGHITSQYVTAANALQSQKARRRIIAYVESYDDVLFWRTVLSQFENSQRYFEVMLPTKNSDGRRLIGRGKKSALQCLMKGTGRDMIACVDADYDYLLQGCTESSKIMLETPFVFHTYAYAIENLLCYAEALHNVCVMVTLNDRRIFDFSSFFHDYSFAIWPLFSWSVALYRRDMFNVMTISDMDKVISLGKITMDNAGVNINKVREKVQQRVNQLRKSYPEIAQIIPGVREDLKRLGVTPETTYLYVHGHHLFDKVVLPLMASVCDRLVKDREGEIHRQSIHRVQMNNELSCYANSLEDITSMLKKNTGYMMSPVFRNIVSQFDVMQI